MNNLLRLAAQRMFARTTGPVLRTPRRRRLVTWSLLLTLGLGVSGSFAYVLTGGRWFDGRTTIYIGIFGSDPDGAQFSAALQDAIDEWNERTPFRFVADSDYVNPCTGYSPSGTSFPNGGGDGRNGIDFGSSVCGNAFGPDTLAITLSLGQTGTLGFDYIAESDIIFNTRFDWSVYDGPRRSRVDFRRVALHELGHVLGLNHERTAQAIMADRITDLDALTADDIAGATALYGTPATCPIQAVVLNRLHRDSLATDDCRVQQLYGLGNDTSRVDTYRLDLAEPATLRLRMASTTVDSVLLLTDLQLNGIDVFDGSGDTCDVNEQVTLEAGSYLLLANTYETPEKCGGNTGGYTLTVSDSPYPLLGNTGNTRSGAALSHASFSARARLDSDAASVSRSSFSASDRITVEARIDPDPAHVGQSGRLFVLAVLSNGLQFMQLPDGRFVPFPGLGRLQPMAQKVLQARDEMVLVQGLRGAGSGLAGLSFQVYLGYALDTAPLDIHFSAAPLAFSIAP